MGKFSKPPIDFVRPSKCITSLQEFNIRVVMLCNTLKQGLKYDELPAMKASLQAQLDAVMEFYNEND